jgi:hypothetical protein
MRRLTQFYAIGSPCGCTPVSKLVNDPGSAMGSVALPNDEDTTEGVMRSIAL